MPDGRDGLDRVDQPAFIEFQTVLVFGSANWPDTIAIIKMGLVKSPLHPFVANCPNPFAKELEAARRLFESEIDSTDGWEGM